MKQQVVNIHSLLELNPDLATAFVKGEKWALEHMRICESLNAGEPEGFRRPFDGIPRKWCGEACSSSEGCVTCTLPENPKLAKFNRTYKSDETLMSEGVIVISGEVNSQMTLSVRKAIDIATHSQNEILQVWISSDGGDVNEGLKIYDMIRRAPVRKRVGVVREYARSMAVLILQACEERIASSDAHLLIHHSGFQGLTIKTLKNRAKLDYILLCSEEGQRRKNEILMERTKRSLAEIDALCDKDSDMTSQEALEFGLLDRVTDEI